MDIQHAITLKRDAEEQAKRRAEKESVEEQARALKVHADWQNAYSALHRAITRVNQQLVADGFGSEFRYQPQPHSPRDAIAMGILYHNDRRNRWTIAQRTITVSAHGSVKMERGPVSDIGAAPYPIERLTDLAWEDILSRLFQTEGA